MKAGETYVASGKFEFPKVITATFAGIIATICQKIVLGIKKVIVVLILGIKNEKYCFY